MAENDSTAQAPAAKKTWDSRHFSRLMGASPEPSSPRAKKIWEIEQCYKCALIGTCLTRQELRSLARERVYVIEPGHDDYLLHAEFIRISDAQDARGKALHKYLAKKYQSLSRKYLSVATDAEISEMWDKHLAEGLLDSAWWSVLTHPTASAHLIQRLYGQLHMLGHDSLNNHHQERQIRRQLRAKVTMLEEVLVSERGLLRQERRLQAEKIQVLSQAVEQARALERENSRLREEAVELRKQIEQFRKGAEHRAQQVEIDQLRQSRNGLCGRIDELSGELVALQEQLAAALDLAENWEQQHRRLMRQKLEQSEEIALLEQLLRLPMAQGGPCSHCADQHTAQCPGPSLCGRTVLYVGGLNNLIPHYRNLVERHGGRFLHHDGGKEAARSLLPRMLSTADAVLCPIDCVSHDACHCVKKLCKRYQKPFVLMRSAGLSSLVRGLSEIVQ